MTKDFILITMKKVLCQVILLVIIFSKIFIRKINIFSNIHIYVDIALLTNHFHFHVWIVSVPYPQKHYRKHLERSNDNILMWFVIIHMQTFRELLIQLLS